MPDAIDVFVSYARIDNQPVPGSERGWISLFRSTLIPTLGPKLARKCDVFIDTQMQRTKAYPAQLKDALDRSGVLLVFLSSAYLKSKWCRWEREQFLGDGTAGDRPVLAGFGE